MNAITSQVEDFLLDPTKKRIEIKIPRGFRVSSLVNPLALNLRKVALFILSKVPPMELKRKAFNLLGYRFGKDVCLPGYIDVCPYFPTLLTIQEGTLVGGMVKIRTAEVIDRKLILGRVDIGRRVLIGGLTKIKPGVSIPEGVITGLDSTLTQDPPENSLIVGTDKILKRFTKEEKEQFFGHTRPKPSFAKKVRRLTKKFRKDKSLRQIGFRNEGNRLNAGCEWFRARPVARILWNGIMVELALLCPSEFGRKLLLAGMGQNLFGRQIRLGKRVLFDHIYGDMVQVGKNVSIGDGVFLDGHEYTISTTSYSRTRIEDGVTLEKDSGLRAGITVGKGAILKEGSLALKDIGKDEIWAGKPAKKIGKKGA